MLGLDRITFDGYDPQNLDTGVMWNLALLKEVMVGCDGLARRYSQWPEKPFPRSSNSRSFWKP